MFRFLSTFFTALPTTILFFRRWPNTQRDLDTGTLFLGSSVGYACGSSPYMSFSGDDTSAGGQETIIVDISGSHSASLWSSDVIVTLRAGWFTPARGTGPATVTVGLRQKADPDKVESATQLVVLPGTQSGCASTVVGLARVSVDASLAVTLRVDPS